MTEMHIGVRGRLPRGSSCLMKLTACSRVGVAVSSRPTPPTGEPGSPDEELAPSLSAPGSKLSSDI